MAIRTSPLSHGRPRTGTRHGPVPLSVRPATRGTGPEFERDGPFGAVAADGQLDGIARSRLEREIALEVLFRRQCRPVDGEKNVTADGHASPTGVLRSGTRLEDAGRRPAADDIDDE